jgi:hypothetical protein
MPIQTELIRYQSNRHNRGESIPFHSSFSVARESGASAPFTTSSSIQGTPRVFSAKSKSEKMANTGSLQRAMNSEELDCFQPVIDSSIALKKLVSGVSRYLNDETRVQLIKSIDRIYSRNSWDLSDRLISLASFNSFLSFLCAYEVTALPALAVADSGEIYVSLKFPRCRLMLCFKNQPKGVEWKVLGAGVEYGVSLINELGTLLSRVSASE